MTKETMQRAALTATLATLVLIWSSAIDGTGLRKDAAENALMAVNVAHHATLSLDDDAPVKPSMHREPVPAVVGAGAVLIADAILGPADPPAYLQGARAGLLKATNVLWAAVLVVGAFKAAQLVLGGFSWPLAIALLAVAPFSTAAQVWGVDDFYTDLAGAALLTLCMLALVTAARRRRFADFALAGGCYGVLVLTKASFLYIGIGLLFTAAPVYVLLGARGRRRVRAGRLLVCTLCAAAVVAPWIYRNAQQFGVAAVAERGGEMLYTRALMDGMTPDELRGALYAFAHPRLQPLVGNLLGFSEADFERGGRLERLAPATDSDFADADMRAELEGRPDEAVTFYRKARAEHVKLARELDGTVANPVAAADRILLGRALEVIRADLGRHLLVAAALVWRSAPLSLPFLACMLAVALGRRDWPVAMLLLPGFGLLAFDALLTIFVVRYEVMAWPTAMFAVGYALHTLAGSAHAAELRARAAGLFARVCR